MEHHIFLWVDHIPGLSLLPGHIATSLIVSVALILFAYMAKRQLAAARMMWLSLMTR